MRAAISVLAITVLSASLATAQDRARSRYPGGSQQAGPAPQSAPQSAPRSAPRAEAPRQAPAPAPRSTAAIAPRREAPATTATTPRQDTYAATPRREAGATTTPSSRVATPRRDDSIQSGPTQRTWSTAEQRHAISRPRGDNVATGQAIPRDRYPGGDSRTVVVERPRRSVYVAPARRIYSNRYYYYPRDIYPYGYGAFGLGYFYYDPYVWAPVATIHYDGYAYGYGYGYPTGELRLQVRPRDAEVYVDGFYAGMVDDFDGSFQGLRLEEGDYHIEIVAPGYETIAFDVRIQPGRKINYRGDMFELRP